MAPQKANLCHALPMAKLELNRLTIKHTRGLYAIKSSHAQDEELSIGGEHGMTPQNGAAAQGQLEMRPIAIEQNPIRTVCEIREGADSVARER